MARQERLREPMGIAWDSLRDKAMTEKRERYQNRIELLQGTLGLLILQTLQWGPQHGYGISVAIRNRSGELLQVDTGSLYPALHRLEKQKWVKAEWKVSENKQRAKFYQLTAAGKKQLTRERSKWSQLSDAIAGVLQAEEK
jgi:PadR family transcriptional regulator